MHFISCASVGRLIFLADYPIILSYLPGKKKVFTADEKDSAGG
jgi:hypothetical protein